MADSVPEVFYIVDGNLTHTYYVSPAYETVWGRSYRRVYTSILTPGRRPSTRRTASERGRQRCKPSVAKTRAEEKIPGHTA